MYKTVGCFSNSNKLYYIYNKTTSVALRKENIMGKLKKANKTLEEKVTKTYKNIETAVVDGYKKIEDTVVSNYQKIEDKFVDKFLKEDDETIEEAKARIKKEQEELAKKNQEIINNGGK